MKHASERKHRHPSLAVQVNILIILITLSISILMVVINLSNYHKAVLDPYKRRLTELDIKKETLTPYLEYFARFFGTEEMRNARASINTADDYFVDWMEQFPSCTDDDPEKGAENLLMDTVAFDLIIGESMDSIDLDLACGEILKDGVVYRVSYNQKKDGGFSALDEFGKEEAFFDQPPADYQTPVLVNFGSDYMLMRCVVFDLDGSEGRLWLVYNQTRPIEEFHGLMLRSILYLLILTGAASVFSVWLLHRYVTNPIIALARSARRFEAGEDGTYSADKISRVEIRAENELGELSREIQSMQARIVENTESLRNMTAEKERISTELNLASKIQKSMLPGKFPPFPEKKEFDLFASMTPARDVGGDFYDFFLIDDDHLALVMADVSGKGVPGALFMMVSKTILKNNAMMGKSVGEILAMTNNVICDNNDMEMFVTVWMGILELSTGKIMAANAGHEYPAIMKDHCFRLYKDPHSFVIGGMDGVRYKEYELQLEKGEKLFLYTDGLPEATNERGEMFGTDRMIDALNMHAGLNSKEILSGMKNAVDVFVGDAEPFDDLTMLCLEYFG
jgi:serine phosphatase RsbU (regulator of sigma subunit)